MHAKWLGLWATITAIISTTAQAPIRPSGGLVHRSLSGMTLKIHRFSYALSPVPIGECPSSNLIDPV